MGDKVKSLCKWKSSQYVKDMALLKEIVRDPSHICKGCGRVSNDKKRLCKPVKI